MPVAAVAPTVRVRLELTPAVTEVGLKPALTPVGRPEMLRAMLSALPETTAVPMLLLPAAPWATETLPGLALIEKSLVAVEPGRLTVSKVALPRALVLWLVTASPASTLVGRAMVWVEPGMSVQVTPSGLVEALKVLVERTMRR